MPTSSDCSQLQSIMPLKAKVWLSGATKQSKCGNAGGAPGPMIGEQDAAALHHRIGLLADVGAEVGAVRLGRRLQASAVDVEQPAVEGAAQAAVLQPPIGEVGAAMRAGALDQAVAAAGRRGRARGLSPSSRTGLIGRWCRRVRRPARPAASSGASARRPGCRADAGDEFVLFLGEHGEYPQSGERHRRNVDTQPFTVMAGFSTAIARLFWNGYANKSGATGDPSPSRER